MSKVLVSESNLTSIANAIRSKTGSVEPITTDDMGSTITNDIITSRDVGVYRTTSFQDMYAIPGASNGDVCIVEISASQHTGTQYTFIPFNDLGDNIRNGFYSDCYFLFEYTAPDKFLTKDTLVDGGHNYRELATLDLESKNYIMDTASVTDSKYMFKIENIKNDMFAITTLDNMVLYNTSSSYNLAQYDYTDLISKSTVLSDNTYDDQIIKFKDIIEYDGCLIPVYICNTTLCCIRPDAGEPPTYCWLAGRLIPSGKMNIWVSVEGIAPGVYTYVRQNGGWFPKYATDTQNQTKSITVDSNTTTSVSPDPGYLLSGVSITTDVSPNLETKSVTITENKTTTITPTSGKDGLSSVEVITNVPGGYVYTDKHATITIPGNAWQGNSVDIVLSTDTYDIDTNVIPQVCVPPNSSVENTNNVINASLSVNSLVIYVNGSLQAINVNISAVNIPTTSLDVEVFGLYRKVV